MSDAVAVLDHALEAAAASGASDVHVEPHAGGGLVRLRRDGTLVELVELDRPRCRELVARIKALADLDVTERQRPQDGSFTREVLSRPLELRVSVIPTVHEESVVLRVLDRGVTGLDLARLGADELTRAALEALAERPAGLVLIAGPTGSGKTTTLYAMLGVADTAQRKVMTIEDPIEYELPSATQVEIDPAFGVTFDRAVRAFLRQDPDVILVGEIRDGATATAAVEASLTGHLVLATIHAGDSATATRRLYDLGAPRSLLIEAVAAVVCQRLLRTLCSACRVPLAGAELAAAQALLGASAETPLFELGGCRECAGLGFRGRFAVMDALAADPALMGQLLDTLEVPRGRLVGGQNLSDRAIAAALAGVTSPSEVHHKVLG